MEFPRSFKDPAYDALDAQVEARLQLPTGLLRAIRVHGERSNADAVSEAGARTPYQIIPATARAIEKKYGLDPLLSPENAALAAGYLLQESLQRNRGDVAAAVGEYHGGTDRAAWGPRTRAYANRVMVAMPEAVRAPAAPENRVAGPGRRLSAELDAEQAGPSLARVFEAYAAGRMDPESAAELEADVAAGRVVPPRGVNVKAPAATGGGPLQGVLDAYWSGKMTPDERAEIESDVAAGRLQLPPGVELASRASQIPGGMATPPAAPPEPSGMQRLGDATASLNPAAALVGLVRNPMQALDNARGLLETGAAVGSGMTTGALGMLGGTAGAMAAAAARGELGTQEAAQRIEQGAAEGLQATTFSPRTAAGGAMTETVGKVMQATVPVVPLGAELAMAGRAAGAAAGAAGDAAAAQAARLAEVKAKVQAAAARRMEQAAGRPTPGTMGSVGAAGTDMALQRQVTADTLPVPIKLTKGQASRDPAQLQFERETAKDPNLGDPLRQNDALQNRQLQQNLDWMINESGAQAPDAIGAGRVVNSALVNAAARSKAEFKVKFRAADKAGELEAPVPVQPLVDYLQQNESLNQGNLAGGSLGLLERELVRLGGATRDAEGRLVAGQLSLRDAELVRRQMNNAIGADPANATNMRAGVQVKELIDTATEGLGGNLYRDARRARQRHAQLFEDNAIVADLLRNRRGTADRAVAMEHIFDRTILNGSRDDVSMLRRTLQIAGGEEGAQAWKELQGQTVRWLRDEATKNVATDSAGQTVFSPAAFNRALQKLEHGGRLEFIVSKRGAETLRALNEIAKDVLTTPPGTVNHSNTAAVLLAALTEMGALGSVAGVPLPIMSGLRFASQHIKDRRTRLRVLDALGRGTSPSPAPPPRNRPAPPAPQPRTMH